MITPFLPLARLAAAFIVASTLPGVAQIDEAWSQARAPQGNPSEPAWGFWPDAPRAWQQTHWGFVEKAKAGGVDVLFLGDSITKGWSGAGKEIWAEKYAPLKALNIGIGGDTTRQTLWRLDHGAMEGIQPRVVVLMIGVNNVFTSTGTDGEIVEGIEATVRKIRTLSPVSRVLLLGILPLGNEAQNARIKNINAGIAKLSGAGVNFLDMGGQFLGDDGNVEPALYTRDLVHLAGPGYVKWSEVMEPALQEMIK